MGDKLPTTPLYEGTPANKVNLAELVGNKKAVVFALPGAFTPGCTKVVEFYCVTHVAYSIDFSIAYDDDDDESIVMFAHSYSYKQLRARAC